jgi:tetratricopeptide (TPR) repeat protein
LIARARQNLGVGRLTDAKADVTACLDNPGGLERAARLVNARIQDELDSKRALDLADEAFAQGRLAEAADQLRQASGTLAFRPRLTALRDRVRAAGVVDSMARMVSGTATQHLSEAQKALRAKNYEGAASNAESCIVLDPAAYTCYRVLGAADGFLGRTADAALNYQRYLDRAPKREPEVRWVREALDKYLAQPP